jgi:hypothetical protein
MNANPLPMTDLLAAYRQAALEIRALPRKGIRCHLEQHQGMTGPFLKIVDDHPGVPQDARRNREKLVSVEL